MREKKCLSAVITRSTIVLGCFLFLAPTQAQSASQLNNTNFVGGDIGVVWNANSPGKCQTECDKNKKCKAWTWVRPSALPFIPRAGLKGFCALKGSIPNKTPDNCCVSGYTNRGGGNNNMVTGTVTGIVKEVDMSRVIPSILSQKSQSAPQLNNTNFTGGDIGAIWNANDSGKCQTECDKNKKCKSWTWVRPGAIPAIARPGLNGFCALKGSIPNKTPDNCCVSGYAKGVNSNNGMVTGTVTGTVTEVDTGRMLQISHQRTCQDYASKAVTQQQRNLEASCGFSGPQWNDNYNDHFNWCTHGENLKYTQGEEQRRQDALEQCSTKHQASRQAQVKSPGSPRFSAPGSQRTLNHASSIPQLKTVDVAGFSGGMLMIDALQAATRHQPDCNELRSSLIAMMNGGGYAYMPSGALRWSPAQPIKLDRNDSRIRSIVANHKNDINAQIHEFSRLHNALRKNDLARKFITAPAINQQLAATVSQLSANLELNKLNQLQQIEGAEESRPTLGVGDNRIMDLSQATNAQIREVCSIRDNESKNPERNQIFWEKGYAFLLGKNFGRIAGNVYLEYEACKGRNAQRCEDRRLQGLPMPVKKLPLKLISKFSWSDRLIGVKLPKQWPDDLFLMSGHPKFLVRLANIQSTVASPPVLLTRSMPYVTTVETDSGYDPGGLLLHSHWIEWDDTNASNHKIFWVHTQKLTQGSGLVRINCKGCPKGERVSSARMISPGDNIYIYGQDFGAQPGDIFLTYDNPTVPGRTLNNLRRSIPIEAGGIGWWRDDRIHIRIKPSTSLPNTATRPYLVITDLNGERITANYTLAFTPKMAYKVVSGETWWKMGAGEDDHIKVSGDGSSMVVSHGTGGCSILDSNERNIDHFFDKGVPRKEIRVVKAGIGQISPDASMGGFLKKWGKDLANECGTGGVPLCFFSFLGKKALNSMFRSLFGDSGAYYIYPTLNNWHDPSDPRLDVEWVNTCYGPNGNKPIRYSVRFVLFGPEHLLYSKK